MAGCDALLYPQDTRQVLTAIETAVAGARLPARRIDESIERIEAAVARPSELNGLWGLDRDRDWALDVALRAVHVVRGRPGLREGAIRLHTIDDDLGGPYPPPARDDFARTLTAAGYRLAGDDGAPDMVAVYADIRAWKGRPGLSPDALQQLENIVTPDTTIVLFGHPRLATGLRGNHVLSAWGGEQIMQQAAALWLHKASGQ
jgi:hypothetical protein